MMYVKFNLKKIYLIFRQKNPRVLDFDWQMSFELLDLIGRLAEGLEEEHDLE